MNIKPDTVNLPVWASRDFSHRTDTFPNNLGRV